jgi:hypothetical protein
MKRQRKIVAALCTVNAGERRTQAVGSMTDRTINQMASLNAARTVTLYHPNVATG